MTRYYVALEDGKLYLECGRKEACAWRIQIVVVSSMDLKQAPGAPLPMLRRPLPSAALSCSGLAWLFSIATPAWGCSKVLRCVLWEVGQ